MSARAWQRRHAREEYKALRRRGLAGDVILGELLRTGPQSEPITREELERQFPELLDPVLWSELMTAVRRFARLMGLPDLVDRPVFWRCVYLATIAAGRADREERS